MKSVVFYPRAIAERLVPTNDDVMLSIHDRGQAPANLQPGWLNILRLSFHDIDLPQEGRDIFNESQANDILAFIEEHKDSVCITVHCNMGVSRSAAVAMFIAQQQDRVLFQQKRAFFHPERPAQYNRFVYTKLNNVLWGNAPSAFESLPAMP